MAKGVFSFTPILRGGISFPGKAYPLSYIFSLTHEIVSNILKGILRGGAFWISSYAIQFMDLTTWSLFVIIAWWSLKVPSIKNTNMLHKPVESSHCQFAVCQDRTSKPFHIEIQIQKSSNVYFDIERRKQRNKLLCPDWSGQSYKTRKRKKIVTKRRKSWGLITFSDLTPWHKMFFRQNLFQLQI